MNANKVGQDFNHIGTKYPMAINTRPYPRWIAWVFLIGVAAVFAAAVFGFMQVGG